MINNIFLKSRCVIRGLVLAGSAALFLTGCSNSSNGTAPFASSKLRVVHASPDAPKVQLSLNGAVLESGEVLDYGEATEHERRLAGTDAISVDAFLPGNTKTTVIGPVDVTIEANTNYDVFAIGSVGDETLEAFVMTRPESFNSTLVRVSVAHLAETIPMVDVYVTEPGADLTMATKLDGNGFSYKETLGPEFVPAGDYQIRITLAGAFDPVYDSGTIPLAAGADLTIAAVINTSVTDADARPKSPVALLIANGDSISTAYSAEDGVELRAGHNSSDSPAVDIVANDNTAAPLFEDLTFPNFTDYEQIPAGDYNVKVLAANVMDTSMSLIDEDVTLENGLIYTAIALNEVEGEDPGIELLTLLDDPRSIATEAKLRVIHGSTLAGATEVDGETVLGGPVDLYVTGEGADISNLNPTEFSFPYKGDSGYLQLAAGTYNVTVTAEGSKDVVIDPATITVANGGVYTILARDGVNQMGTDVTLLDDLAP